MFLPFGISSFIYIVMSDQIPEIHKEISDKKSFYILLAFIMGMTFMGLLLKLE